MKRVIAGLGLLGVGYWLTRERADHGAKRKGGGPPPSMMGVNAQPSIAGFHPQGATFSVWAIELDDGTAARAVKISPVGLPQKWVARKKTGSGSVTPYTAGHSDDLDTLPLRLEDASIVRVAKDQITEMLRSSPDSPIEAKDFDQGLPLVISFGNVSMVSNPELAVAEFDWDGEDPR